MLDHRLEPHDKNQLELKLAYPIEPDARRFRCRVEAYLYVSRTLGLTPQTYTSKEFFADTAAFVRLKTPAVALSALADPERAMALFTKVRGPLEALGEGDRCADGDAVTELKLLGCIFKSALRDEGGALVARLGALDAEEPAGAALGPRVQEVHRLVAGFVEALEGALERLRALGAACESAVIPRHVQDVWHAVDEYVALDSEEVLTRLVDVLDESALSAADRSATAATRVCLTAAAVAVASYRRGRGFPSGDPEGLDVETLPFRRRLLKRVISSVLYLDARHERQGQLARDTVGMVAAALAMLFAVLVAVYAQTTWDMFSGAFIGIMVGSYIIKDRIKAWFTRYIGRRIRRFAPDRIVTVRDPTGKRVLGRVRETFQMLAPEEIDPEISACRHVDHPATIAEQGRPEVVLRYVKDVRLSPRALRGLGLEGVEGLNDIIRFNVHRLRQRMDDPDEEFRYVDPESHEVVEAPCRRVYHLNMVLRTTTRHGRRIQTSGLDRVRIIVSQKGILRVEVVGPQLLAGAVDGVTGRALDPSA